MSKVIQAGVQRDRDDGARLEFVAERGCAEDSAFINFFRHEGFKQGCDVTRVERRRLIIDDTVGFAGLDGTEAGVAVLADGIRTAQSTPMVSRKC